MNWQEDFDEESEEYSDDDW